MRLLRASRRFALLLLGNLLVLLVLFCAAELTYRIAKDGFEGLRSPPEVPFSNLGTRGVYLASPELGYRLNPNMPEINRFGIRHGRVSVPKPEELFRMLVLGDSLAWDKNGFVDRTRRALQRPGFEVLNASVPGYTSYQEVLFFEQFLQPLEPDLVVWSYCMNDNYRFLHRFDENARMLFTEEVYETFQINNTWDLVVSRSYLLSLLRARLASTDLREKNWDADTPWGNRIDEIAWKDFSWEIYQEALENLLGMTRARGADLVIVIFPTRQQLVYGARTPESNQLDERLDKPQRAVKALCESHAIPCLDLLPIFSQETDAPARLFRDTVHLTAEGHSVAARAIAHFLTSERLVPQGRL